MARALGPEVLAKLRRLPMTSADLQLLFGQTQAVTSHVLSGLTDQEDIVALGHSRARIYAATDRVLGPPVRVPTYRVDEVGNPEAYGWLIPLASSRMAFLNPRGDFEIFDGSSMTCDLRDFLVVFLLEPIQNYSDLPQASGDFIRTIAPSVRGRAGFFNFGELQVLRPYISTQVRLPYLALENTKIQCKPGRPSSGESAN